MIFKIINQFVSYGMLKAKVKAIETLQDLIDRMSDDCNHDGENF